MTNASEELSSGFGTLFPVMQSVTWFQVLVCHMCPTFLVALAILPTPRLCNRCWSCMRGLRWMIGPCCMRPYVNSGGTGNGRKILSQKSGMCMGNGVVCLGPVLIRNGVIFRTTITTGADMSAINAMLVKLTTWSQSPNYAISPDTHPKHLWMKCAKLAPNVADLDQKMFCFKHINYELVLVMMYAPRSLCWTSAFPSRLCEMVCHALCPPWARPLDCWQYVSVFARQHIGMGEWWSWRAAFGFIQGIQIMGERKQDFVTWLSYITAWCFFFNCFPGSSIFPMVS